uniref:Nuclear nucleic acid-binding protein C1D n=1 Tax=Astyanax mexicanus TaxID=7994 RepID=A0A3B1JGN2_ASTMX
MAEESSAEEYPMEIDEFLTGFQSSVNNVQSVIQTLMSVSKSEHLKLDPLEQAKLDLMSAYTLNSLFWMYLVTQGINPKEHGIKQELVRPHVYLKYSLLSFKIYILMVSISRNAALHTFITNLSPVFKIMCETSHALHGVIGPRVLMQDV